MTATQDKSGEMTEQKMVDVTIDGVETAVPEGTLIIRAAEQVGHRDPEILRPPLAGAGGRVPPVPRGCRGSRP